MNIAEMMMHYIHPVYEILVVVLNVLSVLILVWGMLRASFRYVSLRSHVKATDKKGRARAIAHVKTELGTYILLSLEILIITDIIESTMERSIEFLVRLVLIVVIRTTLSVFLQREIKHEQQELKELENEKEAEKLE